MTPAELRELVDTQLTASFLVALDAIKSSETAGRQALKRGELPFRVIRVGKTLRVPTCDLAVLLLAAPDSSEAGPASPADATTLSDQESPDAFTVRRNRTA